MANKNFACNFRGDDKPGKSHVKKLKELHTLVMTGLGGLLPDLRDSGLIDIKEVVMEVEKDLPPDNVNERPYHYAMCFNRLDQITNSIYIHEKALESLVKATKNQPMSEQELKARLDELEWIAANHNFTKRNSLNELIEALLDLAVVTRTQHNYEVSVRRLFEGVDDDLSSNPRFANKEKKHVRFGGVTHVGLTSKRWDVDPRYATDVNRGPRNVFSD